ncbi:MAG: carbonic anhydrase, partial [Planctomycetota bacterium]
CNRFVDSLKQYMNDEQQAIDDLVIAPDDPRVVRSLDSALSDRSVALLYSWREACDVEMEQIFEAVAWAVPNLQVENVALIGHSLSRGVDAVGVPEGFGGRKSQRASEATDSGYRQLVAGIQSSLAESARASDSFARWVDEFCEIPAIRAAREKERLQVLGLFYSAVSGSFAAYDLQRRTFQTLGG